MLKTALALSLACMLSACASVELTHVHDKDGIRVHGIGVFNMCGRTVALIGSASCFEEKVLPAASEK